MLRGMASSWFTWSRANEALRPRDQTPRRRQGCLRPPGCLPGREIGGPEAQQRRDQGLEHGGGYGGCSEAEGSEDPPFSRLPGRDAPPLRWRRGSGYYGDRRARSRDYDEGWRRPKCSADGAPIRGVGIGGESWAGSLEARRERQNRGDRKSGV